MPQTLFSQPLLAQTAPPIPRHDTPPEPRQDRRFYLVGERDRSSPRPAAAAGRTTISINGRWHALRGTKATFEQLLRIAFPKQELTDPGAATVTVFNSTMGVGSRSFALLTPGDVVPLEDGLIITANATSAS